MKITLIDIFYILYDVFFALIFVRLLNKTSLKKSSTDNTFIKFASIIVLVSLFVVLDVFSMSPFFIVKPVCIILLMVFAKVFYMNYFVENIIMALIYYTTSLVMEHVLLGVFSRFINIPYIECASIAISCLLFLIVAEFILANILDYKNYIFTNTEFIFLFAFGLISFVLILLSDKFNNGFFVDFFVIICVIANLIFSALIKIVREREKNEALLIERNKFLEEQDQLVKEKEEEKYRSYQKSVEFNEQVRRINHDLFHHFNFLLSCEGLPQSARDYINELKGTVDEASNYFNTGSSILDLILEEKCKQAEKLGIKFKVMGDFSNGLNLEPASVSIVFGNLLNNAIEGASKIQDNRYKSVDVVFYQEPHHRIYIKISNTANTKDLIIENGKLKTTKKDKKLHGIGIDSINREIRKYNGRVITSIEDNRFITEIIVPVH